MLAGTCLLLCTQVTTLAQIGVPGEPLRVMTRNVYVGADIFRVLSLTDPLLILAEIAAVYQTVQMTDFTARAEVLADEILLAQPHVIGLQEVSLIRRQSPGDVLSGNPVPATEVETDFLQILLDALAARQLQYVVAVSVDNADIELPLFGATLDDIRLTDRDVMLVRVDVPFSNSVSGNYSDNVVINLAGSIINFNRGYNRIDAQVGLITYRIVNTHLEVGSQTDIQSLQSAELVSLLDTAGTAEGELPLVLLGDFNSSPVSPASAAYGQLQNAGFADLWTHRSIDDNDPGYTCCHSETLMDPTSTFSSRIDLVWTRLGDNAEFGLVEAEVTGDDPTLRTPSGLWPSDHGGVVATFDYIDVQPDTDGDGVSDNADNCTLISNSDQRDSNGDGFGNVCDPDFNQDNVVNFLDVNYYAQQFLGNDPHADLNGDGVVGFLDFAILVNYFLLPPGPGAWLPPR